MSLHDAARVDRPVPPDLDRRSQIHDAVIAFYREVVFDELLAPMFDEVAEVDWAEHIPKLISFWCRVLLHEPGYQGAVLRAHEEVHAAEPFRQEHFDRWYALWVETLDSRWAGPQVERAKHHAARIGGVIARRLTDDDWSPLGA